MIDLACSVSLVLIVCLLGAAYGVRVLASGAASYDRVKREKGSVLFGPGAMQMGYWGLEPFGRALAALGVSPNAISLASLALGFAAAVAVALGHFGMASALAVFCSLCDTLDGMVARLTKTSSDAGEVLDAAVDRYVEFAFLGGLAFYHHADLPWLGVALAAILGSFMVSYATAKAEALHVEAPRGAMRRLERAVYLTVGAGLCPFTATWAARGGPSWVSEAPLLAAVTLVAVVGNVSAVRRLSSVARSVRARDAERAAPKKGVDPPTLKLESSPPLAPRPAERAGGA